MYISHESYQVHIYKVGLNVFVSLRNHGDCGSTLLANMEIEPSGRTTTLLFSESGVDLDLSCASEVEVENVGA
jgi:hypothetical protein